VDISIRQTVEEVVQIQELQAKQKGVEVKLRTQGLGEGLDWLDEKRLQQVVLNYLSNALKFLTKENSKVDILLQKVSSANQDEAKTFLKERVNAFYGRDLMKKSHYHRDPYELFKPATCDKLVLSVLDNGVGIRREDQGRLFKLFGCLKNTRQMNAQGIGLGLAISRMITEEFGGQVNLCSKPTVGSLFQSSFELQPPQADATAQPQNLAKTGSNYTD